MAFGCPLIGPGRTPGSDCDNAVPGSARAAENKGTQANAENFLIPISYILRDSIRMLRHAAKRGRYYLLGAMGTQQKRISIFCLLLAFAVNGPALAADLEGR